MTFNKFSKKIEDNFEEIREFHKGLNEPTAGQNLSSEKTSAVSYFGNMIALPFRALWNLIVIVGAISLEVLWIGFVFGSVLGVILLLIFFPEGFLLPLGLFKFMVPLWPDHPNM